jgi:hypothetical protein
VALSHFYFVVSKVYTDDIANNSNLDATVLVKDRGCFRVVWSQPIFYGSYWPTTEPVIDKKERTLVALKGLIAEMTPGEQYRQDLKRQKQKEKALEASAAWRLRLHKSQERLLKEIKNLKIDVLYKPSKLDLPFRWRYFVVREKNLKKESLTLEVLYDNGRIDTQYIIFSDYKQIHGTFEQVYDKKEKAKIGLKGLVSL